MPWQKNPLSADLLTDEQIVNAVMNETKPDDFVGVRGGDRSRTPRAGGEGGKILDMTAFTMEMMRGVEQMEFGYEAWVQGLNIKNHEMLKDIIASNQKYILADNTIRKYAPLVVVYRELEASHRTTLSLWLWGEGVPTSGWRFPTAGWRLIIGVIWGVPNSGLDAYYGGDLGSSNRGLEISNRGLEG